jgi:hypothetical protein
VANAPGDGSSGSGLALPENRETVITKPPAAQVAEGSGISLEEGTAAELGAPMEGMLLGH